MAEQRKDSVMQEHALESIAKITGWTVRFENYLPVREPYPEPIYRWYCSCGVVGGKSKSHEASAASFLRHREENSNV